MKKLFTSIFLLFIGLAVFAQTPTSFNYQAVLRDASGGILANQQVEIGVTLLQGSVTGTEVFTETHSVSTNNFGLANLQIGSINTAGMETVDWSAGSYFIQISVDGTIMGTSQLLSVPFALHAKTVENDKVEDADADPGNELQVLSISNDTIYLSNGGKVKLPAETDPAFTNWDKSSGISITESQIADLDHFTGDDISGNETAFDGWDKDVSDDFTTTDETDPVFSSSLAAAITAADTTRWASNNYTQNELQELKLENQQLSISGGNTIDLSEAYYIADSSATNELQDITLNGTQLSISKGSSVDLASLQDGTGTDNQTISLDGNQLVISNGNRIYLPYIRTEGDSNPHNEIQTLSIANDTIFLSREGGQVKLPAEEDPVFTAWDKSTGIKITESQITDLDHFTNSDEIDPVYAADSTALKNAIAKNKTAIVDTAFLLRTDLASKLALADTATLLNSETAQNKQAIIDTAANIRADMFTTEIDPVFTAWDKSTGIEITESQITDLKHFTGDSINGNETAFDGWDKDASDDFDGQYSSLSGTPQNVSNFTNDAGYITSPNDADADPNNELELPSQTGNAGKYLTTDGSNTSWEAISTAHNALTLGTANGLSLSNQQLSLATATTSSAGALSSSDKTKLNKIASTRTTASGYNSTAMGYETTASRRHSTAMGYKTTASGDGSTAMGNCIKASGYNSFGIGLDDTERTLSKDSTMAIMGGNVGIGTTSPSKKLHVYQNDEGQPLLLETNGDYAGFALKNNTKQWVLNNSTKGFGIWDDAASAYRMLIDDAGDVGIGTTSPSKKLHVYQDDEGQPLLLETNGDYAGFALKNNTKQWVLNNSTKGFGIWDDAASAYRMLIDDAGDVGIGTTSPSKKLHVYQDDEGQPLLLETNGDYAGFALKNNTKQWALNNSTKGFGIWDDAASAYRMLIDDDGDVGIGTTSPSYKLDVDGTIRATSDISAEDDVFVNDNLYANNIYTKFGGTSEQVYYRLYGSMGVVGYNSTGSATPSDKRLKENIQTITNPLEKLELLRGVTYNWNQKAKDYFIKDIEKNVGFVDSLSEAEKEVLLEKEKQKVLEEANRNTMSFIAQEVVENFPQWVKENEDGVKLIDMKGINSLLVEAVKELKTEKDAEIAQLKQTIENLQNANTALKVEKDTEVGKLQTENSEIKQRLETLEALVKNTLNTIAEEKASAQK